MDQKGVAVAGKKKIILLVLFCFSLMLAAGCETVGGLAKGGATTIDYTAKGAAKDTKGLFGGIMWVDDWMTRNLW